MSFHALSAAMTQTVFAELGEPATFTDGATTVETRAELDEVTQVVGELGQLADPRPSIALPKADVGRPRKGTITMLGRTFELDQLVDGGDDGHVVRYYVREVT